ncbi:hypothetical protein C1O66_10805 [Paucibacter aquatile]|uniref:Uncharacterized protein n=1 Tax=Kinneretia aquatilis TaxID=2070761 RepID=A0A2N8KWX8_9BURK|nr:hypothetical protein [Paucibacter aquatile]PND37968.1 hypothetical protein C1O66_10805 [Paucibacter aquatile]
MFPRARGLALPVLCLLALAAGPSRALDISPPRLHSALGQPLEVQIGLRLSPGDKISKTLTDPCFKVELSVGERTLKTAEFMRAIDWQAADGSIQMRLHTAAPVTEPLVQLSLGCPRQQFSLMLDPALALPPTAAGPLQPAPERAAAGQSPAKASAPARGHRGGPALRLDASLSERAPDTPAAAAGAGADWFAPLAGIRLLLALDVGGPEGATPETHPGVEGPRPDRIKQAEAQFLALQNEQRQLQAEMAQLSSELLAREQRRAAGQAQSTGWLIGLAALALLAGAAAWFWQRRQATGQG